MSSREERIARNEVLFREVNERIRHVHVGAGDLGSRDTFAVLCECGDQNCVEEIHLKPREYEQVRADPRQFVIAPGHGIPEVEEIVDEGEGFEVARKHAEEAEVAERTDPRG
jgi:hypothetical protein